jgi:hypothetical protein
MSVQTIPAEGQYTDAEIFVDEVEESALSQKTEGYIYG